MLKQLLQCNVKNICQEVNVFKVRISRKTLGVGHHQHNCFSCQIYYHNVFPQIEAFYISMKKMLIKNGVNHALVMCNQFATFFYSLIYKRSFHVASFDSLFSTPWCYQLLFTQMWKKVMHRGCPFFFELHPDLLNPLGYCKNWADFFKITCHTNLLQISFIDKVYFWFLNLSCGTEKSEHVHQPWQSGKCKKTFKF